MKEVISDPKNLNTSNQKFQEIIIRIATDFINVSIENFDNTILEAFAILGSFLDLDRVYTFDYDKDSHAMHNTYEWISANTTSKKEERQRIQFEPLFENLVRAHMRGNSVIVEDIETLNKKSELYKMLFSANVLSFYTLPLMNQDVCIGFIAFDDNKKTRKWNVIENRLLRTFAEMMTNLLMRQKRELKIIEMQISADEASRAKGQFLANMSHEIRTPLSGIYNTFYLLGTTDLSMEQNQYLSVGQASIDSLSSIVDDVLDISRIEAGKMEVYEDLFNIEEELIRIIRTQKNFADDKGLSIHFKFDYRINFDILGDYRKLRQILLNLINNAIKYTNEGHIDIEVQMITEDPLQIEFVVRDTGIGIDQSEIEHLSDAFYQVDSSESRKYQGTGLGLSISNQLIDLLHGKMIIDSEINKGSTFKVILPFVKNRTYEYPLTNKMKALYVIDQIEQSEIEGLLSSMGMITHTFESIDDRKVEAIIFENPIKNSEMIQRLKDEYGHEHTITISSATPENKRFKKIDCFFDLPVSRQTLYQKILNKFDSDRKAQHSTEYKNILSGYALVVDDNRLNRIALESILVKQGIKSISVDSGKKAIDLVKKEDFNIILMDIQMPEMDGIETTRRIRALGKKYQSIPIVAVTANAFFNDYDLMKTTQINDVIFKPIRIDHLNQVLRKYIHTGTNIQIPDELFSFDEKDFRQRFEGSDDIAIEVVDSFISEYRGDLQKLKSAILLKDSEEIIKAAHYFKGSCSYLSGKRSVWMLNYIMNSAKDKLLDLMNLCYDMLESEVHELVKSIKEFKI
ncbi:MAG: ATP-binding protein [Acholeplasmataceae bacterium]|nr:ATP-binding protein [Acholeplasmataceae bacterium]